MGMNRTMGKAMEAATVAPTARAGPIRPNAVLLRDA
jgi:hypothetical protein